MTAKKTLISTIGTLSALSLSLGAIAGEQADIHLFEAQDLPSGFMVDHPNPAEGSCGEGSRGEEKEEKEEEEEKGEEGACGEGACGEGACGEGSCGA